MSVKDLRQRFSTSEKMELVGESWNLSGQERGRFLRKTGIHSVELNSWRKQMEDGLKGGKSLDRGTKKTLESRIKLLEKELQEARALIELQKKVQDLFAEKEDKNTVQKKDPKS